MVVLKADGNVIVLSQLVKPAPVGEALAQFLVPLKSTVGYVSVKGSDTQF
jgi:hypothetical protein